MIIVCVCFSWPLPPSSCGGWAPADEGSQHQQPLPARQPGQAGPEDSINIARQTECRLPLQLRVTFVRVTLTL